MATAQRREVYSGSGGEGKKVLYMAMELDNTRWKLALTTGAKIRKISVTARDQEGVRKAISRTKEVWRLLGGTKVRSCYEAGRDGFWIDRFLKREGIKNLVVDPGSIEVPKGRKRRKTDRLDAEQLVRRLIRYWNGEKTVWGIARIPSEKEEDERRLHRERERLKKERTAHRNRIRSLLILEGVTRMPGVDYDRFLQKVRRWNGEPLEKGLCAELKQECERLEMVDRHLWGVNKLKEARLKDPQTEAEKKAKKLLKLRGVGPESAWVLGKEFFGWRNFNNRREVGQLAGLTGTPYNSGQSNREQGISKAGNKRVRYIMIELAWMWLRFQSGSELSKWFEKRFGDGGTRMRKVGIVALARKLLVALWKYLERDEVPVGAILAEA